MVIHKAQFTQHKTHESHRVIDNDMNASGYTQRVSINIQQRSIDRALKMIPIYRHCKIPVPVLRLY